MFHWISKVFGQSAAERNGGSNGLIRHMDSNKYSLMLDILMYREDDQWVALALDMDLRGYGNTTNEAHKDLMDHIRMQVCFAIQKNDFDLAYHPAEKRYYDLFNQAKADALRTFIEGPKSEPIYLATGEHVSRSEFGGRCFALA